MAIIPISSNQTNGVITNGIPQGVNSLFGVVTGSSVIATTRLEEILTRARDTLSDPNAERWTEARLIRLADEAQRAIAAFAGLLRKQVTIPLVMGTTDYILPADAHRVIRVTNELNQAVQLVSHEYADTHFGTLWEQFISSPVTAIIFDKLNGRHLKVYPAPPTPASATLPAATPPNQVYGVATSGTAQAEGVSSPYGIATGFTVSSDIVLTVDYLANPAPLVKLSDPLELNEVFDRAMKFYITGMALRDDKDVQNRQIGNEELTLYQAELRQAISDGMMDSTSMGTNYDVAYEKVI